MEVTSAPQCLGCPKPKSHLTDVEIASILSFAEADWSTRRIAEKIHRSQTVVSRTLRNYEFESFHTRKPRPKRGRKTSVYDDRLLLRIAKINDHLPFQDIINISGVPISTRTLSRRLNEVQLYSRIRQRKPMLNAHHKHARLAWAQQYKDWTVQDWKRVIWSDECPIQLGGQGCRQRCIRKKGEAYKEQNCLPTVRSGHVTLMVWACFTGDRLGPLIVCEEGNVDREVYAELLFDGLLSLVDDLLAVPNDATMIEVTTENTLLFMHDNAPCHKPDDIKELLKEAHIPVMKWPAQSPDLNPIENLWPDLKARFRKQFYELGYHPSRSRDTLQQCERLLQDVWQSTALELIANLIESMPRRVEAVIVAKGGPIKY